MSIPDPAFSEDTPAGAGRASGEMPLLGHLRELRDRVVITSVAILITTLLTIVFAERLIDFLAEPARAHVSEDEFRLIFTKPVRLRRPPTFAWACWAASPCPCRSSCTRC